MEYLLEMNNITKKFGDLLANDNITIKVRKGSIHCIVGENGAGKSTLMNILYGLLKPTSGQILYQQQSVQFSSPLESIAMGLGMIHQHFMLIPSMTVLDNIIMGYEIGSVKLNRKQSMKEIGPLFESFGLETDLFYRKLGELPVGIQQKIEIIKALYRKANLIVFDEPTAVLTPQEIEDFFQLVHKLRDEGKTIIFISHKLNEIMEISDEISIMRAGKLIDCVNREDVNEESLARLMIGRDLVEQKVEYQPNNNPEIIAVKNLTTSVKLGSVPLKNLSFGVKQGEIFGIAGVAGNGQTELVNILVGTQAPTGGTVTIDQVDVTNIPCNKRTQKLAYIPEDRQAEGLVISFSIAENMLLGKVDLARFLKHKIFLNFHSIYESAQQAVKEYSIRISCSIHDQLSALSGGNQQKVIVARELNDDPNIILAVNPTRGIDIGSIEYIHSCLLDQRKKGKTIVLISNELTEIMALSDRIGIIHDGQITKILDNDNLTKEQIGYYMLGGKDADHVQEGVAG